MRTTRTRCLLPLLLAQLALATAADDGTGTAVPSCAAKLVPCSGYLNSTATPPPSCCGPLKDAAFNETKCVCAVLLNKAALQAFGVAPEQGVALAKRCGVTTDASVCARYSDAGSGGAGSSTSAGGAAPNTVTKPTANGGTAHRLRSTSALVGVISFLVSWWWTIMAY